MCHAGQRHDIQLNKIHLIIAVIIGANRTYSSAKANTVYLPETRFNENVDLVHAQCMSVNVDALSKFSTILT